MCIFRTTSVWACNRIRLCPLPSSSSSSSSSGSSSPTPAATASWVLPSLSLLSLPPSHSLATIPPPSSSSCSSTLFDYAQLISVNVCECMWIYSLPCESAYLRVCVWVRLLNQEQRLAGVIARRRRRRRYMWHIHTHTNTHQYVYAACKRGQFHNSIAYVICKFIAFKY